MTDKPYTDADVELVARAIYESDDSLSPPEWRTPWADYRQPARADYYLNARAVLDALAAVGRLR